MAAKKTATSKATTDSGTSTTSKRKASAPKAAKSQPAESSTKSQAAESSAKTRPAAKAAAKKPLKLSEAQEKILRQIESSGEAGYTPGQKTELRSIDKLRELKLVKRGAKDKATGEYPYMISATGKKHLAGASKSGE